MKKLKVLIISTLLLTFGITTSVFADASDAVQGVQVNEKTGVISDSSYDNIITPSMKNNTIWADRIFEQGNGLASPIFAPANEETNIDEDDEDLVDNEEITEKPLHRIIFSQTKDPNQRTYRTNITELMKQGKKFTFDRPYLIYRYTQNLYGGERDNTNIIADSDAKLDLSHVLTGEVYDLSGNRIPSKYTVSSNGEILEAKQYTVIREDDTVTKDDLQEFAKYLKEHINTDKYSAEDDVIIGQELVSNGEEDPVVDTSFPYLGNPVYKDKNDSGNIIKFPSAFEKLGLSSNPTATQIREAIVKNNYMVKEGSGEDVSFTLNSTKEEELSKHLTNPKTPGNTVALPSVTDMQNEVKRVNSNGILFTWKVTSDPNAAIAETTSTALNNYLNTNKSDYSNIYKEQYNDSTEPINDEIADLVLTAVSSAYDRGNTPEERLNNIWNIDYTNEITNKLQATAEQAAEIESGLLASTISGAKEKLDKNDPKDYYDIENIFEAYAQNAANIQLASDLSETNYYNSENIQELFNMYRMQYTYEAMTDLQSDQMYSADTGTLKVGLYVYTPLYNTNPYINTNTRISDTDIEVGKIKITDNFFAYKYFMCIGRHEPYNVYVETFVADRTMSLHTFDTDLNFERDLTGLKLATAETRDDVDNNENITDITGQELPELLMSTYVGACTEYYKDKYTWDFTEFIAQEGAETSELGNTYITPDRPTFDKKYSKVQWRIQENIDEYTDVNPNLPDGAEPYYWYEAYECGWSDFAYTQHFIYPDIHSVDVTYYDPVLRQSVEDDTGQYRRIDNTKTNPDLIPYNSNFVDKRIHEELDGSGKYTNHFDMNRYGTNVSLTRYIDLPQYMDMYHEVSIVPTGEDGVIIDYNTDENAIEPANVNAMERINDDDTIYTRATLLLDGASRSIPKLFEPIHPEIEYLGFMEKDGVEHHYYILDYTVSTFGRFTEERNVQGNGLDGDYVTTPFIYDNLPFAFTIRNPYVGEGYSSVDYKEELAKYQYDTFLNLGKYSNNPDLQAINADPEIKQLVNVFEVSDTEINPEVGIDDDALSQQWTLQANKVPGVFDVNVQYKTGLVVAFMTDCPDYVRTDDIQFRIDSQAYVKRYNNLPDEKKPQNVVRINKTNGTVDYLPNYCVYLNNLYPGCTYMVENVAIHVGGAIDSDLYYTQYDGDISAFDIKGKLTHKCVGQIPQIQYINDLTVFYLKTTPVEPECKFWIDDLSQGNYSNIEEWGDPLIIDIRGNQELNKNKYTFIVAFDIPCASIYQMYDCEWGAANKSTYKKFEVISPDLIMNTYFSEFDPAHPTKHVNDKGARLLDNVYMDFPTDGKEYYAYSIISNIMPVDQGTFIPQINVTYSDGTNHTYNMETIDTGNPRTQFNYFKIETPGTYYIVTTGRQIRLNATTLPMHYGSLSFTQRAGDEYPTVKVTSEEEKLPDEKTSTVFLMKKNKYVWVEYPWNPKVGVYVSYPGNTYTTLAQKVNFDDGKGKKGTRWLVVIQNPEALEDENKYVVSPGLYYIADARCEIRDRVTSNLLCGYPTIEEKGTTGNGKLHVEYVKNKGTLTWFPGMQMFWVDDRPENFKIAGWDQYTYDDRVSNRFNKGVQYFVTETEHIEEVTEDSQLYKDYGQKGSYIHRMTVPYPGTFVRMDYPEDGCSLYSTSCHEVPNAPTDPENIAFDWALSIYAPQRAFIGTTRASFYDKDVKELADTKHYTNPNNDIRVVYLAFPELYDNGQNPMYQAALSHENDWNIDASWLNVKIHLYKTGYYNQLPEKPTSIEEYFTQDNIDVGKIYYSFNDDLELYKPSYLQPTDAPYPGVYPLIANIIMPTMNKMYLGGVNTSYRYIVKQTNDKNETHQWYDDNDVAYDMHMSKAIPNSRYAKANGYKNAKSLPRNWKVISSDFTTDDDRYGYYIDPRKMNPVPKVTTPEGKTEDVVKVQPAQGSTRVGGLLTDTMPPDPWAPNVDTDYVKNSTTGKVEYDERNPWTLPDKVYDLPNPSLEDQYIDKDKYLYTETVDGQKYVKNVLRLEPNYDYHTNHETHMHDLIVDSTYYDRNKDDEDGGAIKLESYSRLNDGDPTDNPSDKTHLFTYTIGVAGSRNNILQSNHTGIFYIRPLRTQKLTITVSSPLGARSEYDLNVILIDDIKRSSKSTTDGTARINTEPNGKFDTTFQDRHFSYYKIPRAEIIDYNPTERAYRTERTTSNVVTVYATFKTVPSKYLQGTEKLQADTIKYPEDKIGYVYNSDLIHSILNKKDTNESAEMMDKKYEEVNKYLEKYKSDRIKLFTEYVVKGDEDIRVNQENWTFEGKNIKVNPDPWTTKEHKNKLPSGTLDDDKNHYEQYFSHYIPKYVNEDTEYIATVYTPTIDEFVRTMYNTRTSGNISIGSWVKKVLGSYWLQTDKTNNGQSWKDIDLFTNFNVPLEICPESMEDVVVSYIYDDESPTLVRTTPQRISQLQEFNSDDIQVKPIQPIFVNNKDDK